MSLYQIILVSALASTAWGMFGSMKNITVTGHLICGGWHYQKAKVVLWEDDTWNYDDCLNETVSGSKGRFTVYGQTREVRHIEPYLLITHACDENSSVNTYCTYVDRYPVPLEKVGGVYDMNVVKLGTPTDKRETKCTNSMLDE